MSQKYKMKPLLINTYDTGGAANACVRLHKGLLAEGIESNFLCRYKNISSIQNSFEIGLSKEIESKLPDSLKGIYRKYAKSPYLLNFEIPFKYIHYKLKRSKLLDYYSTPFSKYDITKTDLYKEADIINLHWVAHLLNYGDFFRKNKKPVIWTFHDMSVFTGGEHYSETIIGIDEKGYPLKRTFTNSEKELFDRVVKLKVNIFEHVNNLQIVSPSKWLANEAKNSEVLGRFPVHVIPNGIDTTVFHPKDRKIARELLGIPNEKTVILFVAEAISISRKGFEYLRRAFNLIGKENIILCAIGTQQLKDNNSNILELGRINDEQTMSFVYSAADVFVIPSLMDNLPNTVLESLACGTPVIGFPVGGITDMVQDEINGYLCSEISVFSLAETLKKFISIPDKFDREKIANAAANKYSLHQQARKYMKLYDSML